MKVLEYIRAVPEVENRLADDMSRKIYEMRMDYAIYQDREMLREQFQTLDLNWKFTGNFDKFVEEIQPKTIIIFGAGEGGQYTLGILRRSKYKNIEVVFCDNDSSKWTKTRRGGVLI